MAGCEQLIANHPNPNPPKPFATFADHAGVNGLDICRDPGFGFEGDAFVALFGDIAPVTARPGTPRGFKVVRVDTRTGEVFDFAVNRIAGPANILPHKGMERPSHCQFGPDGALYIVDWGEIRMAPEVGGFGCRWARAPFGAFAAPRGQEVIVRPNQLSCGLTPRGLWPE